MSITKAVRFEAWEPAFDEALARWRAIPYDRTTSNCLLMIRDCAIAMTGEDPLLASGMHVDQVLTPIGLARCVARCGGVIGVVDTCLQVRVPPLLARKGDALMLAYEDESGDRPFGVHDGQHGVFRSDAGITVRPLSEVAIAWRVGL